MKLKFIPRLILTILLLANFAGSFAADTFTVGKGTFLLNGKPFTIKAAELHYPRIPKEYWENRIKMSKALGMNTVCLYVFWNSHESEEGVFDFTGQNDLRKFIELCAANDMKVILRPGPYVCAEWEMGGLPWWLLKKKDIRLREDDPYFLERVERFQEALSHEVADLTVSNGGPIIMVQVENEYGSYGEDKEYIRKIRDILKKYFGEETVLFQCDWNSNFTLNGLDDLVWTMNFGTGADIDTQFEELKRLRPETPLMCSEFWSGWFDKWGADHETRPSDDMVAGIEEMLSKGISFSLYMTHGGTNWGHWAGANSPGYSPDVTSYDYDAPINESGHPTEKFFKLREALSRYLPEGDTLPEIPDVAKPVTIDRFSLTEVAPLFENLGNPVYDADIKTIEDYDMGFGSILYSTQIPAIETGSEILVDEPHDFAQIFINDEFVGTLDRRNGEKRLVVERSYPEGARIDILVEATGRINFGRAIKDYKGITSSVSIDGKELHDWSVYLLPDDLEFYNSMSFRPLIKSSEEISAQEPYPRGVYRGVFTLSDPSDTFLNLESWGKGLVYVNGHGIGRFWSIGPQQTLYMPGPWLREGENEILVFDILGPETAEIEGLDSPVYDKVRNPASENNVSTSDAVYETGLVDLTPLSEMTFIGGNGWKEVRFPEVVTTDGLFLEILSTHDGNLPAIAEIYLIDSEGRRIGRENWKVYASSSDRGTGNHTPDKIIDLQESTYWSPDSADNERPYVRIELGNVENLSAIQYLPRMENGAPGGIKDFRLYVKEQR